MDSKSQIRDKKKAQFSYSSQAISSGRKKATVVLVVVLIGVLAIGAYLLLSPSSDNPASTGVATTAGSEPAASRDITIPLSDLSNKAKFFDYKLSDNKPVRFFVVRSSDGQYRAAMDACDMCYHAKRGYHQEGDDMVCNNCGLHFHSSQINEKHGGCNPVGLPRTIEGNQLVIKASEIESRGSYF
jgi:uncharacterized membrane protein